jgi:hypothetical protein
MKKNKLFFFKLYSEINLNEIINLEIYQLNKIYITHFSQIPAKKIIKFLKKKNKPIPVQKNTYLISQNNDLLLKNLKIFSRIAFIKNFVYKLYGKLYYTEKIKRIRKKKHNFFFFKLLVFLQNTINIDLNNDQYLQNIRDYIRFNVQNKRYLNFR